ncbi:non-ribosomal peptide synthetase [Xenorhabdus cabanillasii]|uniref:Non-ribosomal peptide synthetase n=1 Tax=Xenorhabdus cabanillasii JM26 TaxID=1427517 RepID=W1ILI8_9GAMM|nr:non-ribosomal peptide synthetase [Xenorhabdus cabanillasii]PHM75658.1 PvdJ [Xenorhabdus cabanillasii JM26]CDL79304.1 putative non-ribosomal peptide synthetase [Xenorhabdus cabanillasii JM26]
MDSVEERSEGMNRKQEQYSLEQILLSRRKTSASMIEPQVWTNLEKPVSLSMAQQRIWLHEKLEKCGALYNMPCALRLRGSLDVEALRQAIELHLQHHSVLCSRFIECDGKPQQVYNPISRLELPKLLMTNEAEATYWMSCDADMPFNLEEGPPLRCHLLCLSEQDHILSLTVHHIVSDGWSQGIMLREISFAYNSITKGQSVHLPPPLIQYADYGSWQRSWLEGERIQQQLIFWADQLRGAPALLALPTEQPRAVQQSYEGGTLHFNIDAGRTVRIRHLSRELNVTLYMLLLAAFNVLLSRYSSSYDIVIGSPVANRFPKETEGLVGFFANTLVMRNQVIPEQTFATFLQQVKKNALAAYAHQDVPFDLVVEYLRPERSLSYNPLFQVEFVLQKAIQRHFTLEKVEVDVMDRSSSYTKFDLTLSLEDGADVLHGLIEFNSRLFSAEFAQRMVTHYLTILDSILDDPGQPIWALEMLTSSELDTLRQWAGDSEQSIDRGVLHFFADQVSIRPNDIAVCHGDDHLSYAELEQYANRLAHAMLRADVAQGERVALYLDRGVDYLAALLAVFKLGAAFVPFNPEQNMIRNAQMIQSAEIKLILASPTYAEKVAIFSNDIFILTLQREALKSMPSFWPYSPSWVPDAMAYMIFTSGSTGTPKGAMVTHQGMVNHLLAKIDDLGLDASDVLAQIAVQTFDVSVWQFLAMLLVGGRTEVLTGETAWQPEPLLHQLQNRKVTVLETVPSHLEIILDEVQHNATTYILPNLRWIISNGEPISVVLAERWFDIFPRKPLMNAYGPTECSDDVTHYILLSKPTSLRPYLPIGKPITNARVYVLDAYQQPVPVGAIGEIHIGGICVGLGYFKDEEKTCYSFVEDRLSGIQGSRLYKSGDLARYYSDGTLELLGRSDFQLKIRGCRIEAGEIETALCRHSAVEQCLVMGSHDRTGLIQLVAYVVPSQRPAPSAAVLQAFCRELLPDYMIPSGICLLDEFPLLPNGKIDRVKLPPIHTFELSSDQQYQAPRNLIETHLVEIWAELLGLQRVGITDNFFQLGGHSLLAVELVAQCREVLGEQMSLQILFKYPTIQKLMAFIYSTPQEV